MTDDLIRHIDAAKAAYLAELEWWEEPPGRASGSFRRLLRLINLDAPELVIEKEVEILASNIAYMQKRRRDSLN